MTKGSFHRLLYLVQVAAAIGMLAGCGSDAALESRAQQTPDANELPSESLAGTAPSTMIELQHFDAYEYYRDVIDLHADAPAVPGFTKSRNGDRGFLSCFRSRAFK
jgi:hypothetical protein